ncbi:MAG: PhzF family phenazine biosynthesis protein [Rhizobiaceae bacterium]|nr:PhzF family phenazine biosynthesis protein [Rhizobiaceae bacterium]
MARRRAYRIYDVFTDTPLAGNPLAVVLDATGLDGAAMQKIAAEFNLSETVFVLPPADARHRASIRIFTPDYEMPFAGHPTVGSAVALAEAGGGSAEAAIFVIEEKIGAVRCAVSSREGMAFAEFDLPKLPVRLELTATKEAIAVALGLDPRDVGFENHAVGLWSGGVPYITVPLSGLDAAANAVLDGRAWAALAPLSDFGEPACAYVYTRQSRLPGSAFHARMFVPGSPSWEDPATGSAVAALAGAINHFDRPADGLAQVWIEQGVEMGRPSRIRLELDVAAGVIKGARIGGNAVRVAQGELLV